MHTHALIQIQTLSLMSIEYNEGDNVSCCVMEVRQDGTVIVSISPDLLEEASKMKKKKKKKSTGNSGGLTKRGRLKLAEVQVTTVMKGYHDNVC